MKCRIIRILAGPLLVIAIAVQAKPVLSHPHAWIDLWIDVLFDEAGDVTGLRQTWLFGDFYSAWAVEGLDRDGDGVPDPDKLAELLRENMKNLAEIGYFTTVKIGEDPVNFAKVSEMSSRMRGNRLEMTFVVPFAKAVPATDKPLVYAVYDPTYYIEVLHAEAKDTIRLRGAPDGCRYRREEANPNPETVALAAALDRTQTAGDGLGVLFAEKVTVQCGP